MQINYNLAKRLKEAGYKLPSAHENEMALIITPFQWKEGRTIFRAPTLSELIEACGLPFEMHGDSEGWQASKTQFGPGAFDETGEGPTPEEAVASLWLALNEKK